MPTNENGASSPANARGGTDWAALKALTEAEREAAALDDPDAPPLPAGRKMRRRPASKRTRMHLGLSQADFARRYGIPLATVEDWERYVAEPDAIARAHLAAIAADPEGVAKAVAEVSPSAAAE